MRVALALEYDGRRFAGFERQPRQRTIQGELERALSDIAHHPVRCICAGRTDAGVHGIGQIVHFDTLAERPQRAWILGVNAQLPTDLSVRWAGVVADDFHARFSALRRAYRYSIYVRRARAALLDGRAMWRRTALDLDGMQAAAAALVGEHDFSAYRAAACQAHSPVRTIHQLEVSCADAPSASSSCRVIHIDVVANAFLQHMVRNIVGVLVAIGSGEASPAWAGEVLAGRDRRRGGVTAPAHGLCFMKVEYPPRYGIESEAGPALLAEAVVAGTAG